MLLVYILETNDHEHWYIGTTRNLKERLADHNAGKSPHTSKFSGDWFLKTCVAFSDEKKAFSFEKYLKTHSGRAFCKRHL